MRQDYVAEYVNPHEKFVTQKSAKKSYREGDDFVKKHQRRHVEIEDKVLQMKTYHFLGKLLNNMAVAHIEWNDICLGEGVAYLVVVGAIRRLLDWSVLLLVAHLNADDRVHVEAGQLASLDNGDADLEVLGFQTCR